MMNFHPSVRPPKVTVQLVQTPQQLSTIIDGYCAMSRLPQTLLEVRVSGKFDTLDGTPLDGTFLHYGFSQVKGVVYIDIVVRGEKVSVTNFQFFDVSIEGV